MLNVILTTILEIGAYVPGIVAIAAALAVFGAAWGIGGIGKSAMEAIARQPEAKGDIRTSLIIGCALAEATAVYGFVIALLIIIMLGSK